MVSNFIYKTLFVVIFFFTICYLFLYSLFYKTDVFADSLEGRIRESFKKHSDGFLVDYSSFDGNFDQGFTFNEIILKGIVLKYILRVFLLNFYMIKHFYHQ